MVTELTNNTKKTALNTRLLSNDVKRDQTTFKNSSILRGFSSGIEKCDADPVIGVAVIDICSMIGPRTIVDAFRNGFAATETGLRESSGLIINCLIPGVFAYGIAKLVKGYTMGEEYKHIPVEKIWADEKAINSLSHIYGDEKFNIEGYVNHIVINLKGLKGKSWESISDSTEVLDKEGKAITKDSIKRKFVAAIKEGESLTISKEKYNELYNDIAKKLGATKNVQFKNGGEPVETSLESLIRNSYSMGKAFIKGKINSEHQLNDFKERLVKLLNRKSVAGIITICGVAATVQSINRYITQKRSGKKGFCGYSDFDKRQNQEKTEKEKKKLWFLKGLAVLGMLGTALLSMSSKGREGLFSKEIVKFFQFKGVFPSMDQCRFIFAATFLGRVLAADDDNELRETTLRDILGFLHLYFLGQFVAKGAAQLMDKDKLLFNDTKPLDANAGIWKEIVHWFKNLELKSADEIKNLPINETVRESLGIKRNMAIFAGLAYSMLMLGIFIPIFNKKRTDKVDAERKMKAKLNNISDNKPVETTLTESNPFFGEDKQLFKAFIMN